MSQSTSEAQLIARELQAEVDPSTEPPFKSKLIDNLNHHSAKAKKGLYLRLPPPQVNAGDCLFSYDSLWTGEESKLFDADGTLPRDLVTIGKNGKVMSIWIFDSHDTGGKLPEVVLDPVPDFDTQPGVCVFDMGVEGKVSFIPSLFLEMVPKIGQKVQFTLTEGLDF